MAHLYQFYDLLLWHTSVVDAFGSNTQLIELLKTILP